MLLMLITTLIRQEDFFTYIRASFCFIIVVLYVNIFSLMEFAESYVKIIRFLSIVSIIGYFAHIIAPEIFNLFIVQNLNGIKYSNWILFIQYYGDGMAAVRNYGFAWEPGAFATCVCLSMFLEIFVLKKNFSFKNIGLYFVTIVTTFSTTGIIACIVLCLYVVFIDGMIAECVKMKIAICSVITLFIALQFKDFFLDTTTSSTFGKLINYFTYETSVTTSTNVRINAITKVIDAFFQRPIFGWGYIGLSNETYEFTLGMNTCTFINWFAVYGVIFGGIMLTGVFRFSKCIGNKKSLRIFVILFLFLITISENYIYNALIIILVLYGFNGYDKHENNGDNIEVYEQK